jgi:hypothetical protein
MMRQIYKGLFHEIILFQDLIRQLGSTYGNGQLELLDWFPLFAVILAAALVFNSLIPATVIGRNIARKDEDMLGRSSLLSFILYCLGFRESSHKLWLEGIHCRQKFGKLISC